jgi:hypothetical protein
MPAYPLFWESYEMVIWLRRIRPVSASRYIS